jgi:hypothetical protein
MRPTNNNLNILRKNSKLLFVITKILHGEYIMFVFHLDSLFSTCEVMAFVLEEFFIFIEVNDLYYFRKFPV